MTGPLSLLGPITGQQPAPPERLVSTPPSIVADTAHRTAIAPVDPGLSPDAALARARELTAGLDKAGTFADRHRMVAEALALREYAAQGNPAEAEPTDGATGEPQEAEAEGEPTGAELSRLGEEYQAAVADLDAARLVDRPALDKALRTATRGELSMDFHDAWVRGLDGWQNKLAAMPEGEREAAMLAGEEVIATRLFKGNEVAFQDAVAEIGRGVALLEGLTGARKGDLARALNETGALASPEVFIMARAAARGILAKYRRKGGG